MVQRIPTHPEPDPDEAAAYIHDTLKVLVRLADDTNLSRLAVRLRTVLTESLTEPPSWR